MTAPAAPAPVIETPPEAIPAATPPAEPVPAATPPAAPAAPAAPETPPEARRPLSRRDARSEAVRAPEGAVVPSETPPAGATPVPAPGAEGAPAAELATPAAPAPAAAPALIPVDIPLGHPARESGATQWMARNETEARTMRGALNSWVRRQEVASLAAQNEELQRWKAEREAQDSATQKWTQTPEYKAAVEEYNELLATRGEAVAKQYWAGVSAGFERMATEEFQRTWGAVEQQNNARSAERWMGEAWQNVSTLPAVVRQLPKFSAWFEETVDTFNYELGANRFPDLSSPEFYAKPAEERQALVHKEFMRIFGNRLTREADVTSVLRSGEQDRIQRDQQAAAVAAAQQRERAAADAAAVERYKQEQAAKRGQIPPAHPLANLAVASRDRLPVGSEAAEPAADMSPHQRRKLARQSAIHRGAGGP